MSKFTLTFMCETSVFTDDPSIEISRILRATADKIEIGLNPMRNGLDGDPIRDINGNRIGEWEFVSHTDQ